MEFPVNRDGFAEYLEGTPAKEDVLDCYDRIEDCVFLSSASRVAGDEINKVESRLIGGEQPYTEKELQTFADEIYRQYEMMLKE